MVNNEHSSEPSRHRALSDIDVSMVEVARSNGDGGYYDPADGSVFLAFEGEVLNDDGEVADPDEEDWVYIDTDDSRDGFRDMVDFAESVTDPLVSGRLTRTLERNGPFRRFKDELWEQGKPLMALWNRFSTERTESRAIQWIADNDLCDEAEAEAAIRQRLEAADLVLEEVARMGHSSPQ